ncbi:N-acetylmuramoyl-L-alanine amidase family protein [Bacillus cereus]|uniref:N-acetylmuramoyl-L-alanine amidase family protein n=1 Tax=Bacillus cereus TaxID=1396 RepID=UPI0009535968|nr:N-acetylmuramoyl-L-alanine amidase [Bacillus cereus]OLR27695.1 N-acetylmuramoyl-L-alanine amidase [Bacillus cereus]
MKQRAILLLFIILIMSTGFGLIHAKARKNIAKEDLHLKRKTIIIDPGHGGGDRGAQGKNYGTIEKDLNLKVAQNIKKELEERTGAKVILTREKDTSLLPVIKQKEELQARVKVAKDNAADLYISIHHDTFEDTNVEGITTHYGVNKRNDKKLAEIVQKAIFNQNIDTRDRGIHASDFLVLRENPSPAILIELGFMSNKSDEKRGNSEKFQTKSQKGIVDGIISYFNSEENK